MRLEERWLTHSKQDDLDSESERRLSAHIAAEYGHECVFITGYPASGMVPVERIELPTFGLQNRCSTAELNRLRY